MTINIENISELSDNELMQQWHAGMSTLYGFMELIDNDIAINKQEVEDFNELVDILKDEIIRRECSPMDLDHVETMLKIEPN